MTHQGGGSFSIRDVAACVNANAAAGSFSVVGDVLGLRGLRAFTLDADGSPLLELAPALPLPLCGGTATAIAPQSMSLRNQLTGIRGRALALRIIVCLPAVLVGSSGATAVAPPSSDEMAIDWTSTAMGSVSMPCVGVGPVSPFEYVRRIAAALFIVRKLFAEPSPKEGGHPIGIASVRWQFLMEMPQMLAGAGASKLEVADALSDVLDKSRDQLVGRSASAVESDTEVPIVFIPTIGNGSFGYAGTLVCETGAGVTSAVHDVGLWILNAVTFGQVDIPQGCVVAVNGAGKPPTPLQFGDAQRGKTMAHEIGHLMWINISDLSLDDIKSHVTGRVMAQGLAKVDTTSGELDMFLTAEERTVFWEDACARSGC